MLGVLSERVAALVIRRSGTILVVAAILAVLSGIAAARLRLNPDMVAFLPAENRAVNDFRRVLNTLGTIDHHVVMITVPKGADPDAYETLVDSVAAQYAKLPSVAAVDSRMPALEEIVDSVLPRFALFLAPSELDAVASRLSDRAIDEAMRQNRLLLQTPQSVAVEPLIRYDPLHLRSVLLDRLRGASGGVALDLTSRYIRSADRSTYLVIVRPRRAAQDVPFANELMRHARAIEQQSIGESQEVATPQFAYAGGYAITHADARLIRADMIENVVVSVIGVLALFLFAFRRAVSILYAAVPMLLAILATFGLASVTFGELGAASAGFAALLAGLGIDFTTILYGRFVEERNRGGSVEAALRETFRVTLPGVAIAALTTAATFAGFLFTDFRGMSQMGFLTASGILLFFLAVALVFPALAARLERDDRPAPRIRLHGFGSAALVRASIRHPRITIGLWIAFVIAMAIAAQHIIFSDDAGRLRASGNAGIAAQEKLTKLFGRGGDPVMLVVEAPTSDEALDASERLAPALRRLTTSGEIGGFETAAGLLPSRARQLQVLEGLHARRAELDPSRILGTFRRAAADHGFRPEVWDAYLELLLQGLAPNETIAIDDPLLRRVSERFLHQTDRGWMAVIYIYPPQGRWRDGAPPSLRALASSDPHLTLTGLTVVSAELRRIARSDATRATIIGTLIVLTILVAGLRSLSRALLTFVPLLAGMTGMLGCMSLLGLELNLMNIFIGLMLVGVATDYAVYMLQRYLESPETFAQLAPQTASAVAIAAMTAIIGYGSFALSHYPGLQSIGYAATFGIGLSSLAAMTLLPAILDLLRIYRASHALRRGSRIHEPS